MSDGEENRSFSGFQASEIFPLSEVLNNDLGDEPAEEATVLVLAVADGGERLDRWLAGQMSERSRSEIQRWIEAGRVTKDGRVLKASYRVAAGDEITVEVPPPQDYEVAPEPILLDVLYEDADLLVINKPAGMVVHPAVGHRHGTLVNAVLYHCPGLEGVGGMQRPGIVHRLDRDTSGLILVAKNDRAHRALQAQFKSHQVQKTYLALVYGRVSLPRGEIRAPIGRDPRHRKRMTVLPGDRGRQAVTRYEVLGYYGRHTLLVCQPLTGRTHQIRVHLAHIKHPIVGDEIYGGRRKPPVPCPRQFLHAQRIRFCLPATGEEVEFSAALPADLTGVLAALGGHDDAGLEVARTSSSPPAASGILRAGRQHD
jgi:23S rRNA pseudouridine1911/1915/1917 synthase